MRLKLKLVLGTIFWSAAVAGAASYTRHPDSSMLAWAIVSSAAAAVVSAMLAGDYIAGEAARYIVGRLTRERDATVEEAVKEVAVSTKRLEDRVVSRVQSANEASLRRVAGEIAQAMRSDGPTPFRRN